MCALVNIHIMKLTLRWLVCTYIACRKKPFFQEYHMCMYLLRHHLCLVHTMPIGSLYYIAVYNILL